MKRIFAAVDGSEHALKAAQLAAQMAGKVGARLTLVHVVVPVVLPADAPAQATNDIMTMVEHDAERMLAQAAKRVAVEGVPIDTRVLHGVPGEAIAEVANAEKIDLVIVGSRGLGVVKRVLLGSVADRVLHLCSQPVLVVR